nr:MAG TPA: hypothetical protein [Caudoviricetes sp.]
MFKDMFKIKGVEFEDKDMQEAYYRGQVDGRTNEQIKAALGMAATGILTAIAYLILGRRNTKYNRELNAAIAEEGKLGESMFLKDQNDEIRKIFGDD